MTPSHDKVYDDLIMRYFKAGQSGERPNDQYEACFDLHYSPVYDEYVKNNGRKPLGNDHMEMIGKAMAACEPQYKGVRERMEKWDLQQKLKAIIKSFDREALIRVKLDY